MSLASELLDRQHYAEAAAVCTDLLSRTPDFRRTAPADIPQDIANGADMKLYVEARFYAIAHNYLGVARARQGSLPEAVAHFREALRLMPQFADARRNLTRALQESGRGSQR